jgi:hypothetical protein
MNDHPLGVPDDTTVLTNGAGDVLRTDPGIGSVVDNLLSLDALLSADVRRAEKTFRFCTRPDLEADMEDTQAQLEALVDSDGRPRKSVDAALASDDDDSRSAEQLSLDMRRLEREYAAAMAVGRVYQMDEDDWTAFTTQWKSVLAENPPYPATFYEALIVRSKARLTDPKTGEVGDVFTVEELRTLRKKVGHPAFNGIAQAAWAANTESGVSVPKSSLSSAVLRHIEQG